MPRSTPLKILTLFSPTEARLLRTAATPVALPELQGASLQRLIGDMLVTMKQAEGVGLAAPQVGQSRRMAVISASADPTLSEPLVLINPTITSSSAKQAGGEEGCLSIPGVFGLVSRSIQLEVKFFDQSGQLQSLSASGLLARIIQHEIDHLNGVLFIDRQPKFTRGQELLP